MRFVLGKHQDLTQTGVQTVNQGEIDNAVFAAEGDRRLGAVGGERFQTGAMAAGQDHRECFVEHSNLSSCRCPVKRLTA